MEHLVRVLDEGWHVLLYPEGKLTFRQGIQPFKTGIGLIAAGAEVQVLPLRLVVEDEGRPQHVPFRRRGRVKLVVGEPLEFEPTGSYIEATQRIEQAVHALG
jgi:1-acyl-sn-glycerol-3-phosphate acyltransferase